jgi:hypothetical protein
MKSLWTSLCVAALIAAGCAHEAREPAPSPDHPANPRAATAPAAPKLSGTLNETDVPAIDAASQPPAAADDKVAEAYTCPHHPKVIEAEPGTCPYCGMTLVPTASRQTSPVRAAPSEKPEGRK